MKNIFVAALLLCLSCDESSLEGSKDGVQLSEVRVEGKPHQTFEYSGGLLAKENVFGVCVSNPSDEYSYSYTNNTLNTLQSTIRGLYSNMASLCDPAKGFHYEEHYEYNINGDLVGVTRENSYTTYSYNSEGLISKQLVQFDNGTLETTYEYDLKGNLTVETGPDGNVTRYEYDDRENPFYRMNQRPGWISPFNKSPNNVISASGHHVFERTITYNNEGFPLEIREDNGFTYIYVYR